MNGASKILTVSYGTFSCTLEGFDDPFNTMKAIAEYFRDLAADDRYFGAEPPTPDAAMLHRIAEREIQRRVEAKVGEHGVVLRAGDAQSPLVAAPAPVVAPAPTVAPAPVVEPAAAPAPAAEMPAAPAPQPVLATPAEAAPAVESAAARLQRLRAAQAQIQAQAPAAAPDFAAVAAPVVAPAPQAYVEDQDAESSFAAPSPTSPAVTLVPAEAPLAAAEVVEIAQPEVSMPEADDSSLSRVMATLQEEPAADTVAQEEEVEVDAPVLSSLRETLAGLMSQDEQLAEDMAEQTVAVELMSEEALPEDASESETDMDAPVFAVAEPAEEDDLLAEEFATAAHTAAPLIDDAAYVEAEEPVAASAELALASDVGVPEASEASLAAALSDDAPAGVEVKEGAPVVAEKLQRARARVIKIRRLDKKEKPVEALSPEDEADLQNTLAALEAEAKPAAAIVAEAEVVKAEAQPAPAENPLSGGADASVERLLAEANQQLEVPEIKRRRSAIAHLKAAVLATVADRRANPKARAQESEAKADPYRKDLDKVVRPTSPNGERPAPLVLVSEQRIYRKSETVADASRPMPQIVASSTASQPQRPVGPVRPRRLGGGNLAQAVSTSVDFEDEEDADAGQPIVADPSRQSFAEFAEQLGANSMSELLEAAGAYCTLVLERPSFTRPLLFQQVSQLPAMAEAKREDSLRNFGKLLREGRFQKTVRGQFALAETSPILTEAKRFAG